MTGVFTVRQDVGTYLVAEVRERLEAALAERLTFELLPLLLDGRRYVVQYGDVLLGHEEIAGLPYTSFTQSATVSLFNPRDAAVGEHAPGDAFPHHTDIRVHEIPVMAGPGEEGRRRFHYDPLLDVWERDP